MKNTILILISIFALISCSREINLDNKSKTLLTFNELPNDLKKIYGTNFRVANDTTDYYALSLDKNYNLIHYWTGMHKQLLTKGFNHYFIINGKKFKLSANQGDPFVLLNKKLYYSTELNLTQYNYKQTTFIEINLAEYLSN